MKLTIALLIALATACPGMASTMSFDDIVSGDDLSYYSTRHHVWFGGSFRAIDHLSSDWGLPYSPPNVLIWTGGTGDWCTVHAGGIEHPIASLSAFFSTEMSVVVRMVGYLAWPHSPFPKVTERLIGAPGEAWESVYVELRADDGSPFDFVAFEAVSSPDARLRFCLDDMTVTPVPEPSSLAALALGLLAAGVGVRRRRR